MSDAGPGTGVSRRQAILGVGAVGGLVAVTAGGVLVTRRPAAPAVTLAIDEPTTQALLTISATLCGGGTCDAAQARPLLALLAADTTLSRGLLDLILDPPVAGTANPRTPAAIAASQAILNYWYVGEFAGAAVPNRAAVYDQLLAWQAMYTLPFAQCKGFGGWAEAPDDVSLGAAAS